MSRKGLMKEGARGGGGVDGHRLPFVVTPARLFSCSAMDWPWDDVA